MRAVASESSACNWSAVARSRPWILMCPAVDAVVAVTFARPKIRSGRLRSLSIVWMRLIGAIRQCTANQPERV